MTEYRASEKAHDSERFANAKAEDAWHLRELLERGLIRLPDSDALRAEMRAIKFEILSTRETSGDRPEGQPRSRGRVDDRGGSRAARGLLQLGSVGVIVSDESEESAATAGAKPRVAGRRS